MKKLMIMMGAAATFSLVAQSADLLGGMDFEAYSEQDPITVDARDPGDTSSELVLWGGNSGESVVAVEDDNKYLKVDTTEALIRKTAASGATEVGPVAIPDNGGDITVSSKVQFTAAEDAPTPEEGDKIIVWMRAATEAVGTEGEEGYVAATKAAVMVTDATGDVVAKEVDDADTFTAAWHTLAIKAVQAGTAQEPTAKFTIVLDGAEITDDDGSAIEFTSLVTGGTEAQTISSIGFKGTGAVDDIGFVSNEGAALVDVTLEAGDIALYDAEGNDFDIGSLKGVAVGSTIKVYVEGAASDYTVTNATIEDGEDGLAVVTIKVAEGLTVTIAEASKPESITPSVTKPETVTWVEDKAPKASYTVGEELDPTAFEATTTTAHKKAVVTVKVNGTVITETYTVQSGDSVEIEVTEEDIKVKVTVDAAAGTTIGGVTAGEVVEGSTLTFTVTVAEGYKADTLVVKNGEKTLEAVDGTYTVTADADVALSTTVEAYATVNVTVNAATGTTVSELAATATEGETLTFTVTVAEGYEADTLVVKNGEEELKPDEEGNYTIVVGTTDIVITTTVEKETPVSPTDWPEDPTTVEGKTASEAYGEAIPAELASVPADTLATWAKANGVAFDASDTIKSEAYLLNCANTDEAIAEGKAAFKLTITVDASGNAVVELPEGKTYNATPVIKGKVDLKDAEWAEKDSTHKFFKAFLSL
ncbi:MAG: hypothetical protein ACI4R9_00890 [Kiritimatiellia bacterium]